jgi:hypothetical protein
MRKLGLVLLILIFSHSLSFAEGPDRKFAGVGIDGVPFGTGKYRYGNWCPAVRRIVQA